MTERTCRTCVHCRPRHYVVGSRLLPFDRCELWDSPTFAAVGSDDRCSREHRSWSPAPWSRRVALRLLTWLERLEAKL